MHRAAPTLAALMLVLAACGGDDKAKRPAAKEGSEEASAATYKREANAMCRRVEKELERVPEPTGPEDFADYLDEVADLAEKYQGRTEALRPPRELRRLHERSLREGEHAIRYFHRLARTLRKSADPAATSKRELPRLVKLIERGNRLAGRMGLKDCVEDLDRLQAEPNPARS